MKAALVELAGELGFDVCRCASAAAPESGEVFRRWLEKGMHGSMAYLGRNAVKRQDPQLVLPRARSVVCVATSYHTQDAGKLQIEGKGLSSQGVVARYASAMDYHDWMGARLRRLSAWLDTEGGPGTRSLWYVDTGPILEREFAQRSGIGFVGKHTNVISRQWGNWILLGEILTTASLEPDTAEPNRCGKCRRCLDSCPTGALAGPFQLDARRCISYLTIENKGPIPEDLRGKIGSRVFGCDDCLAACPWNRLAAEGAAMRGYRRPELTTLDLHELLSLSEAGFRRRFAGTPLVRVKRRGLLRNAGVVLGNIGGPASLDPLRHAAVDPDALVAEHARWAIVQIEARLQGRPAALTHHDP